ncbi:MAG: T9SS type A sorting domain-containing protein [Bacteroidota bacterium]
MSKDNKHMFIVPDDKFENFVYYYDIENKTMKKVCRIEEHVNFDYDENYTFYVDRHIQRRAYLSPNNEYLITNSDENCTILWKIDGLTSVNEIIEKKSPKNIIVEGDIIELESYCDYSVYDLTGKLLKLGNGFQIDTHNLYPGMYFVLLKKGNKEINRFSFIIY